MRCCIQSVGDLQPGHSTVIPFMINAVPILFVVQRYSRPDHDRCTVALVSCDAGSLGFHRCKPEPPKLKFETALELLDVRLDRLKDEAFWCAAPWLAHSPTHSPTHLLTHSRTYLPTYPPEHHRPFLMPRPSLISALTRTSIPTPNYTPTRAVAWLTKVQHPGSSSTPARLMYQLLLAFLAEDSLDQACYATQWRHPLHRPRYLPLHHPSSTSGCFALSAFRATGCAA